MLAGLAATAQDILCHPADLLLSLPLRLPLPAGAKAAGTNCEFSTVSGSYYTTTSYSCGCIPSGSAGFSWQAASSCSSGSNAIASPNVCRITRPGYSETVMGYYVSSACYFPTKRWGNGGTTNIQFVSGTGGTYTVQQLCFAGGSGELGEPCRSGRSGASQPGKRCQLGLHPRMLQCHQSSPLAGRGNCPRCPPAAAGQCGSSTCRSTTATSGTLQVYDDSCKSSVRWSTRSASYVVNACQTVEYLGGGSVTGSCNGVADGFFYIRIR